MAGDLGKTESRRLWKIQDVNPCLIPGLRFSKQIPPAPDAGWAAEIRDMTRSDALLSQVGVRDTSDAEGVLCIKFTCGFQVSETTAALMGISFYHLERRI